MNLIQTLNRRKRIVVVSFFAGLLLMFASALFLERLDQWPLLIIPVTAFLLAVLAMISFGFAFRCPNCGKSLLKTAQKGSIFSLPKNMGHCPYCRRERRKRGQSGVALI